MSGKRPSKSSQGLTLRFCFSSMNGEWRRSWKFGTGISDLGRRTSDVGVQRKYNKWARARGRARVPARSTEHTNDLLFYDQQALGPAESSTSAVCFYPQIFVYICLSAKFVSSSSREPESESESLARRQSRTGPLKPLQLPSAPRGCDE